MQKASSLDQSIDRILKGVGIQKAAEGSTPATQTINVSPLRKVAEALKDYRPAPLSYADFHDVKNGTFDVGRPPAAAPKLAGMGLSLGLRRIAHALEIAHYNHRVKTARDAQNVLKAAEGLILLQPRQGL